MSLELYKLEYIKYYMYGTKTLTSQVTLLQLMLIVKSYYKCIYHFITK